MSSRSIFFVGLLIGAAAAFGCKTPAATGPQVLVGHVAAEDERREITPEERRAFEDTVALFEEQEGAGGLDLDDLRVRFERLVEQAPRIGEAWYNLGVIHERQGEMEKAELAYVRALERKPTLKVAAENLAVIYQSQGKISEAVDLLHQVLMLYPEDPGARARLADIYREVGDLQNANHLVRETFIRDPENVVAHRVLMFLAIARGEPAKARLLAKKVLSLGGEDAEIYWELAKLDMAAEDMDAAIANLQQAATLKPDYIPPRLVLAQMAEVHEDWVSSRKQYEEILEHHPSRADILLNLGVMQRALGEIDEAEATYNRVLELDPDEARAVLNLGILAFRARKQPAEGIERFQRFVEMNRSLPRDHVVFTLIHEAEETIRIEEERIRAEEEARRLEEERIRAEEEEMRRMEEEMRLMEEEMERMEEEMRLQEEEEERLRLEAEQAAEAAEATDSEEGEGGDSEQEGESGEPDAPGEV